MSGHTPGPWTVAQRDPQFDCRRIFAGDKYIASVGNSDDAPWQQDADAAVVAASTDLLALAVEVAKEYEDAADWKDAIGRLQKMARAAIARAEETAS
jgi:hypothetical protein